MKYGLKNYFPRVLIIAGICLLFSFELFGQISTVGGFEGKLPSYWTKGSEPGGATLDWATDSFRSMGRSLKISKSTTADSAAWISENMVDFWSPQHLSNVDIKLGAWVKTENVNTNPATDDEKWWISYVFYNSTGGLIGETRLPIDQSAASSSGFVADTNAVGATILPEDAWTTIIKFVGGKNATGTVWADDFMFYGRGGAWAGQNWNTSVGVPSGWYYWLPPIGGNDGELSNGFENTVVTDAESHTGQYSLKFDMPFDRLPHDAFVGTKRFLFEGGHDKGNGDGFSMLDKVSPGDVLRISVWVKASNLVPDSAAAYPETWGIGYTYAFWQGNGNNDGWNTVTDGDPVDVVFTLPSVTAFDWRQFHLDVTVPADPATRAMSVRLHVYSRFTGTVYFDDLTVKNLTLTATNENDTPGIPKVFELAKNYPNPFNPETTIEFAVPKTSKITIHIFNLLGQKVRSLVNDVYSTGRYKVKWDGKDEFGNLAGSGVYFYGLYTGNTAIVRKMILLK